MKSSSFAYVRPESIADAIAMLGAGETSAALAGGQSLLTLLNLRLTSTDRLVDVSRLPELRGCASDAASVTIGAGVTHAAIEDGLVPDGTRGLMSHVATKIAYRAVRNHGTIGGSVALADPAADWPACLLALDAVALVAGPDGSRTVALDLLLEAAYTTTLDPGELITGFRIARLADGDRWGNAKATRKSGAYSTSAAFAVTRSGATRLVIAGHAPRATLLPRTAAAHDAGGLRPDAIADEVASLDPDADAYTVRCHVATVRQALQQLDMVR